MRSVFLSAILLWLMFFQQVGQAQPGQTGFTFLKLGVGARALAMGEAYTALSGDPSATYYNPAALSQAHNAQLLLMHKEWIQDVKTDFIGAQACLGSIAVGLSVNATSINGIELRQQPGPLLETFDAHDAAFGFSLAYSIDTSLSVGVTGKYLYEKILVYEASGMGLDLGIFYATPWNLRLGASVSNLGSVNELDIESSKLPTLIRFGAAYHRPVEMMEGTLTLASDLVSSTGESKSHVGFGAEVTYHETLALRAGYQTGYEARGFTTGIGVRYDFFQLDYAFVPGNFDLGSTHTFSLGIVFQ